MKGECQPSDVAAQERPNVLIATAHGVTIDQIAVRIFVALPRWYADDEFMNRFAWCNQTEQGWQMGMSWEDMIRDRANWPPCSSGEFAVLDMACAAGTRQDMLPLSLLSLDRDVGRQVVASLAWGVSHDLHDHVLNYTDDDER